MDLFLSLNFRNTSLYNNKFIFQLSDTLPEDTAAKMKSYSLTNRDCRCMTVGQLQLILNDMHSKKQGKF